MTTPVARPRVTRVPAWAILVLSARTVSVASIASACFCTASDSPVSSDSSMDRSCCVTNRRSAGILSPDSSRTMSPGTSSSASSSKEVPARTTLASWVTICLSAAALFWAEYSWKAPISALSNNTITIKIVSEYLPTDRDTSAASKRI